jgi:hypothetical protein
MCRRHLLKIGDAKLSAEALAFCYRQFLGSDMNFRIFRGAFCFLYGLTALCGVRAQSLSVDYSTLCAGSVTLSLEISEIQDACRAARLALIRNVAQQSGNVVDQTSLATQSSLTTAYIDQLSKLRAAIAPNTSTLAAIRAGSVTTPDMDATIYAELMAATSQASAEAAKTMQAATKQCSAVLLHDSTLSSIIRNRKTAIAATELLNEAVGRQIQTLVTVPPPPRFGVAAIDFTEKSNLLGAISGAIAPATLLLDLIGNTSALIASFRPTVSSDSVTVTANYEKRAAIAFTSALLANNISTISFDSVLASGPSTASDTLRIKIDALTKSTRQLFDDTLKVSQYNYTVNDALPGASEAEKKRVAEAQAAAKKNNEARQKIVDDARKLLEASDALRRSILTDTTGADGKLLTQAPIHDFNRLDALIQSGGGNLCTLKFEPADGIADRFAKQRAFGSPEFHARAVGTMPWRLLDSAGRMLAGGNLVADSGWKLFGPSSK